MRCFAWCALARFPQHSTSCKIYDVTTFRLGFCAEVSPGLAPAVILRLGFCAEVSPGLAPMCVDLVAQSRWYDLRGRPLSLVKTGHVTTRSMHLRYQEALDTRK